MKAINIQYGPQGEEDVAHEIEKETITFDDLEFNFHEWIPAAYARIDFPNHYGISVLKENETSYEVTILYRGDATINTPCGYDVLEHQTKDDINGILSTIPHYTDGQWENDNDEIHVPEDEYYPEEHEEYPGNMDNELYFTM